MAKLTAPVKEVARILDLVPYLDSHPYSSISELAREFASTEKEIVASLVALSLCGGTGMTPYDMIEVSYETGFVTLNQHDDLNTPRAFTPEESLALMLGLEMVRESIPTERLDLLKELDDLVRSLTSLSGETIAHTISQATEQSQLLMQAIRSRRRTTISYLGATQSQPIEREISPLSLYDEGGHIYCEAFCHTAEDFRTFRLDRIFKIEILDQSASIEVENHTSSVAGFRASIKLHSFKRENAEIFEVERVDRRSRAKIQTRTKQWAIKAIVASGGEVELLDPTEARAEINHLASDILALYGDL